MIYPNISAISLTISRSNICKHSNVQDILIDIITSLLRRDLIYSPRFFYYIKTNKSSNIKLSFLTFFCLAFTIYFRITDYTFILDDSTVCSQENRDKKEVHDYWALILWDCLATSKMTFDSTQYPLPHMCRINFTQIHQECHGYPAKDHTYDW